MIPGLSLKIINVLASFDIKGKFVRAEEGPMLIMAYVEPAPGTLFSSIKRIEGDVGRSLGISGVRVVEVPNSAKQLQSCICPCRCYPSIYGFAADPPDIL